MDAQERRLQDVWAEKLLRFLHFHRPWWSYDAGAWILGYLLFMQK
jgi:hypothetical protein